jgi:site-specific recombinase XerD
MREWDQLVENYLRVCTTRGLAEDVVFAKRRELDRWGNWLKRKRPKPRVSEIGAELILEYVQSRTHFHSKATVAGVMSHMRCMGEFLVQEGVWQQNPLRWIRSPKIDPRSKLPRRIPKADLSKLFEQAAKIQDPYRKARSLTILVLLYSTGIRRGEITRLNLSDWKPGDCSLRIDSQKVNLERTIPIPSVVKRYVEEYLPVRQNHLIQEGTQDQGALFVGRLGKRVRRDDISCRPCPSIS